MHNECNESVNLWLYLDMSLSQEEKEKFEEHLKTCLWCRRLYDEYTEAMELYRNNAVEEISEKSFEAALAKASAGKKRKRFAIVEILEEFLAGVMRHRMRAALGATFVISAIIATSLIQPDKAPVIPAKTFPAEEVMVWTSAPQSAEVSEIKNTIELIAEDDDEKYVIQSYEEDALTVALYDLDKDLIAIEEEIDQYNF